MKKKATSLSLHRETLHALTGDLVKLALGAGTKTAAQCTQTEVITCFDC